MKICLFVLTQSTNMTDRHRMTAKAALDAAKLYTVALHLLKITIKD